MGNYTELILKTQVREDINDSTKSILNFLFNQEDEPDILPNHPFFKTKHWHQIGRMCSYYHIPWWVSSYEENYIFSRSDLKNQLEDIIELFLDWIAPYLDSGDGECIGWYWYEENPKPALLTFYNDNDTRKWIKIGD